MNLTEAEVDLYIQTYLEYVVEEPELRSRFLHISRTISRKNIIQFGLPSIERLHESLELILDNHSSWRHISLDRRTERDSRMHDVISADTLVGDRDFLIKLEKGRQIADYLQTLLPKDEFSNLLDFFGGVDRLVFLLGISTITKRELRDKGIVQQITLACTLQPDAILLQHEYNRFREGHIRYNPIRTVDSASASIVTAVIERLHGIGDLNLRDALIDYGFKRLIVEENGLTRILGKVNPDLILEVPYLKKWGRDDESMAFGTRAIQKVLYELPGYEKAEVSGDRQEQVRIINDFIDSFHQRPLLEYFIRKGLGSMMCNLYDPKGKKGLKRQHSPKALLEFYSGALDLGWFDRTQDTYVRAWRIRENGMWLRGEESAQLGTEAIEDVFWEIKGYKQAEQAKDRDNQLSVLDRFFSETKPLREYFWSKGLSGMMQKLYDPQGKQGLRRKRSVLALFEFYNCRKRLGWFDKTQSRHIGADRSGIIKVIYRIQS
jgi:hypothetical protein